jgi:serine/threonine-protein kinase
VLGADRFLGEIRVTAKLQHPNILPLFDSGQAAGLLFYAMPFVEGESLRQRLERERQLPVPEALRIAKDIAGGLDYAHRHGVIHRDIKPENVLLHDGRAMIADFGIALAVQSAGAQRITQTGLSLGTPQYMSPEQAMGERSIDARSDIYALGAILYEMLTGDAPFTGSSVQAIVAKVINERPTPVRMLRDSVSPSVERAVLTALAKLPADRYASAKEFADALEAKHSDEESVLPRKSSVQAANWRNPFVLALATLVVILGGFAAWQTFRHRETASDVTVRFPIEIARFVSAGASVGSGLALSADGRTIAYVGGSADASLQQVLVRSMNDPKPRAIAGTEAAQGLFLSPDGKSIGVWARGRLIRASMDGGAPLLLAQGIGYTGASWGSRGVIVLSIRGRLMSIAESGGTLTPLPGDSAGRYEVYPCLPRRWRNRSRGVRDRCGSAAVDDCHGVGPDGTANTAWSRRHLSTRRHGRRAPLRDEHTAADGRSLRSAVTKGPRHASSADDDSRVSGVGHADGRDLGGRNVGLCRRIELVGVGTRRSARCSYTAQLGGAPVRQSAVFTRWQANRAFGRRRQLCECVAVRRGCQNISPFQSRHRGPGGVE